MKNELHPKIKELTKRASALNYRGAYIDASGELQNFDMKLTVEDKTIKGYLAVWGIVDTYGTVFVRGCCAKSINERGPASNSKQKIAFLWQHEVCDPIGRFTKLVEDDYGLYFEAEVDDVENGIRALMQIRSGTLNQFSIGFDYIWDKLEYDEAIDAIIVKECVLFEGSVVTFGSNAETYAVRSPEQLEQLVEQLNDDTYHFIKSLPSNKQLECRQLIKRHASLHSIKPEIPLAEEQPKKDQLKVGDFSLNTAEW